MDSTVEDERKFRELAFKWSIAWDKKDKIAFLAIAAPQIVADYTNYPAVGVVRQCAPKEFVNFAFQEDRLGDSRLQTQHLLGGSVFTRISETEATGNWQVRARHVRTFPDGKTAEWDSSSYIEFTYALINKEWKLGGLRPHTVVATSGSPEEVVGQF